MAGNLRDLGRVDLRRRRRCGGRGRGAVRSLADQIQRRLHLAREIHRRAVPVHVHEIYAGLVPEEMIMKGGHFEAVVQERRHHGIDFVHRQHEVAHHDVHPGPLGHGDPPAESKRCRRLHAADGHAQIVARDIDFQDVRLEIARAAEEREYVLVGCGHLLGSRR